MTRTCDTCTESIGSSLGLMCVLKARLATEPCEHYEREPGSDDDLRMAMDLQRQAFARDVHRMIEDHERMQVRLASLAVRPAVEPMLLRQDASRDADSSGAVPAGEHGAERERGAEA